MTDVAMLSTGKVGTIALVYRFWDALNDPVIGSYSDKTYFQKWGRR